MAYNVFAAYYDRLTGEVDYSRRARYFDRLIRSHSSVSKDTILLDLACGTGSLSLELSGLGYDVIGVDSSADMLSEAMPKCAEGNRVLFLCQDMTALDLYGTVDVAVCALDSLNHITEFAKLKKVFERVSLFTVPGGLFLFDVNTEYKHREVLANQTFVYDLDDLYCVWQNTTDETLSTRISLDFFVRKGQTYVRESESFCERAWTHAQFCELLNQSGFELIRVFAGDTMEPVGPETQRAVYLAYKK